MLKKVVLQGVVGFMSLYAVVFELNKIEQVGKMFTLSVSRLDIRSRDCNTTSFCSELSGERPGEGCMSPRSILFMPIGL